MSNTVSKYIETEREISNYKIKKLEGKSNLDPTKRRILEIEKEFVSIPFEDMGFEKVSEVEEAISVYRQSRTMFHEAYNLRKIRSNRAEKLFDTINNKLFFLENLSFKILSEYVEEINLVDDNEFSLDLRNSFPDVNFDNKDISFLSDMEPIKLSKKRARFQALMYSLGLYMDECVRACKIDSSFSIEELEASNLLLDYLIEDSVEGMFKYYNFSLGFLASTLNGTKGENKYLSKVHEVVDIFDFNFLHKDAQSIPSPIDFDSFYFDSPVISLLVKNKDFKKSKAYGVLLPIQRRGNEKMSLLYKQIYIDGVNITDMFCNSLSNVKAVGSDGKIEYYKALLIKPLELFGSDDKLMSVFDRIISSPYLKIDEDMSRAVVPKTRSEEEGLRETILMLNKRIDWFTRKYSSYDFATNEKNLD